MSVTIKDIGKVAGVSHSTVSRALRDHPAISEETTIRIKALAAEMGYLPSAVARGLKTNRTHALGVIVSRIDDPFFSEIIQGIEDGLRPEGYSLFIAASNRNTGREVGIIRAMGERRVDGLIVCSTHISAAHGRQLRAFGIPIVVVDNQAAEDYEHSIYHDDRDGSFRITRHLLELGHARIAYLGNVRAGRTKDDRRSGFLAAMEAAGHPVPAGYVRLAANGQPSGGVQAVEGILALALRPTAIVCFNDMVAIGLIKALQDAGVPVPAEMSVAGFDDILLSGYTTPALTTFHQPKYQLGYEAVQMILPLITRRASGDQRASRPQNVLLKGKLLGRESTAPPPASVPDKSETIH